MDLMPWDLIACALAGVVCWTLAEYGLHRVLGHDPRTRPNAFAAEHTRHHAEGGYFAPMWKKVLVALAVIPLAAAAAALVVGSVRGAVFGVSFAAMYAAYEAFHWLAHAHPGFTPYGRYLRRHHFHHHFENPRANHGVTSPVWDIVFGTFERPGLVRVPRKLAMPWLVEDGDGALPARLARHYALR